jgi:hypothetical protein
VEPGADDPGPGRKEVVETMNPSAEADPRRSVEKRRKAHRAANRLIVGAGIILAEAGVSPQAPQLKALSAALRAVNRAWEVLDPKSDTTADPEAIRGRTHVPAQGFRRLAP